MRENGSDGRITGNANTPSDGTSHQHINTSRSKQAGMRTDTRKIRLREENNQKKPFSKHAY